MLVTLYLAKVAGDWVVLRLLTLGQWRQHPAFTAYRGFAAWRSLALLPPFFVGHEALHSELYWKTRIVEAALLLATAGELAGYRRAGIICGAAFALHQAALYALPHFGFPALAVSQQFLLADSLLPIPVILGALWGLPNRLSVGLLVAIVGPSLLPATLPDNDWRATLPLLALLVAQSIWVSALRIAPLPKYEGPPRNFFQQYAARLPLKLQRLVNHFGYAVRLP